MTFCDKRPFAKAADVEVNLTAELRKTMSGLLRSAALVSLSSAVSQEQQLCQRDQTILLHEVARAEDAFRAKDPEGQYAPTWAALAAVASPSITLYGLEVRLCRSVEKPRERFCAIAVPTKTTYAYPALAKTGGWPRVSLDEKGVHSHAWSHTSLVLDEANCRVVEAEPRGVAR